MTLLTTDARYEGYPSKVAKLLRCTYPLERNGPPLRSRGGFGKILRNFRRVTDMSIYQPGLFSLIIRLEASSEAEIGNNF